MSKNDDRILELKKQIETKKKSISEKKVRFIPETNCVLNMDGMTINLNVCSDDALLLLLLIRLNSSGVRMVFILRKSHCNSLFRSNSAMKSQESASITSIR